MYQRLSSGVFRGLIPDATGFGKLVFSSNPEIILSKGEGLPLETGVVGNLPPENLNYGKNADDKTFWRGDGVWRQPYLVGSVHTLVSQEPLEPNFLRCDGTQFDGKKYPELLKQLPDSNLPNLTPPIEGTFLFIFAGQPNLI